MVPNASNRPNTRANTLPDGLRLYCRSQAVSTEKIFNMHFSKFHRELSRQDLLGYDHVKHKDNRSHLRGIRSKETELERMAQN